MGKLWEGRSDGRIDDAAERLNSSISFDKRLYREDIEGSAAHARMLGDCGIMPADESALLVSSLKELADEIASGKVEIDDSAEDIHSFIEAELSSRIGDAAKRMHTARSRNDQCVLDLRLWLGKRNDEIAQLARRLSLSVISKAEANLDVIMPGFTHMQHAQPVLFSHWLMAYADMFTRDFERFTALRTRISRSPIGACALAGTSFPIDREAEAALLGMEEVIPNSMDAVSDRDFALEFLFAASLLMMHLSRMSEELIIFSSAQYSFLRPSGAFSTGSSIMPQKRNPDMAELVRGKCGRVYGDLVSLLTVMKALPLCYNKDMQEDKEAVFDAVDTVKAVLEVFARMVETLEINSANMLASARKGYMNATDAADYLAARGMPFRDAYKLVGKMVAHAAGKGVGLEDLSLDELKSFSPLFAEDVYAAISIESCVNRRTSQGGTARKRVEEEIAMARAKLSASAQA